MDLTTSGDLLLALRRSYRFLSSRPRFLGRDGSWNELDQLLDLAVEELAQRVKVTGHRAVVSLVNHLRERHATDGGCRCQLPQRHPCARPKLTVCQQFL